MNTTLHPIAPRPTATPAVETFIPAPVRPRSLTRRQIEQAAIDAHAAGTPWETFWRHVGPHVIALEPRDRHAFHALIRRLTGLVAAGDLDGQTAAGDAPWEADDQANMYPASDDTTAARLQLTFPAVGLLA